MFAGLSVAEKSGSLISSPRENPVVEFAKRKHVCTSLECICWEIHIRLGKNSLISGIDRNRCQNRKVSIVSIVLSILSQYLPKAIAILTPPSDIPNDHMIHSLI